MKTRARNSIFEDNEESKKSSDVSFNSNLLSNSAVYRELSESKLTDWICLFTQPHRERLAQGKLSELGVEVYLPYQKRIVIRNGKRVPMRAPLFSRYIFVRAKSNATNLFSLRRQMGVSGFAAPSYEQSFISNSIINAIKSRENADGYVGVNVPELKNGQTVKILRGPFAAIDAIFKEARDEKRSFLLLSLLGKAHNVLVSNQDLQLVA